VGVQHDAVEAQHFICWDKSMVACQLHTSVASDMARRVHYRCARAVARCVDGWPHECHNDMCMSTMQRLMCMQQCLLMICKLHAAALHEHRDRINKAKPCSGDTSTRCVHTARSESSECAVLTSSTSTRTAGEVVISTHLLNTTAHCCKENGHCTYRRLIKSHDQ
jgi:hypothetical protein